MEGRGKLRTTTFEHLAVTKLLVAEWCHRKAFRSLGLLLTRDLQFEIVYPDPEAGDIRTFDDHLNVWTEGRTSPVDYLIGNSIGHQPSCGFAKYVK